jgi:hypothetical protein
VTLSWTGGRLGAQLVLDPAASNGLAIGTGTKLVSDRDRGKHFDKITTLQAGDVTSQNYATQTSFGNVRTTGQTAYPIVWDDVSGDAYGMTVAAAPYLVALPSAGTYMFQLDVACLPTTLPAPYSIGMISIGGATDGLRGWGASSRNGIGGAFYLDAFDCSYPGGIDTLAGTRVFMQILTVARFTVAGAQVAGVSTPSSGIATRNEYGTARLTILKLSE